MAGSEGAVSGIGTTGDSDLWAKSSRVELQLSDGPAAVLPQPSLKEMLGFMLAQKNQKTPLSLPKGHQGHGARHSKVSHRFLSCSTLPGVGDTSCLVFFNRSSNGSFVSSDFEDSNTDSKPLAGLAGTRGGSLARRASACLGSTFVLGWPTCNVRGLEGPLRHAGWRELVGEGLWLCRSKEPAAGIAGAWLNRFGMDSVAMWG